MDVSDLPRIKVYCEGHPDNDGNPTHERFDFPDYVRHAVQPSGRAMWLQGINFSEDGRIQRRIQTQTVSKIHFDCGRCPFDEQRRMDPIKTRRLHELLERLYAADVPEISVRALIEYCWLS